MIAGRQWKLGLSSEFRTKECEIYWKLSGPFPVHVDVELHISANGKNIYSSKSSITYRGGRILDSFCDEEYEQMVKTSALEICLVVTSIRSLAVPDSIDEISGTPSLKRVKVGE